MSDRNDERAGTGPDAPPTPEEVAEAEALRDALADPSRNNAQAAFARAVALSNEPRAMGDAEHRAIVERAIVQGEARRKRARSRRTGVVVALGGGLALAAALALFVGNAMRPAPMDDASLAHVEPLVPARSTQPLFREPFPRTGGASARIDRIASARAADLRDNRFAAWGVR